MDGFKCLKLKHQVLGKHVRGSHGIVTGFIPDRLFAHIRTILISMILYETGVTTHSTVIHSDSIQYYSAYRTHVNTSS